MPNSPRPGRTYALDSQTHRFSARAYLSREDWAKVGSEDAQMRMAARVSSGNCPRVIRNSRETIRVNPFLGAFKFQRIIERA